MRGLLMDRLPDALPFGQYRCRRCGIVRTYNSGRAVKPDRCPDCRDLECGNGHLWPETPARSVRGARRCMQCERERRRKNRTTNQEGTAA